jgi:hypothetical protein
MLQDFMVAALPDAMLVFLKYTNERFVGSLYSFSLELTGLRGYCRMSQVVKAGGFGNVAGSDGEGTQETFSGPLDRNRSMYEMFEDILDADIPPSALITPETLQEILGDETQLVSSKFRVELGGEILWWTVASVKPYRRGGRSFWIQLNFDLDQDDAQSNPEMEIRVAEDELASLLLRSVKV